LRIHTHKIVDSPSGNRLVEVNDEWVFRFPGTRPSPDKTQKQLKFLTSFAKRSPVAVPEPVYVTDQFVGYRRIAGAPFSPGDPFSPAKMDGLPEEDRQRVAKQLGVFLATLHQSQDKSIDFDTGYLTMRERYDRTTPGNFKEFLDARECRKLDAKLEAINDNSANFVEPTRIIHGDLHFENILWDETKRVITGVIDWSEMGLGIPAMDFINVADFATSRNDQFLRDILHWYGGDDGLFKQVKANAIIEVINWYWYYELKEDSEGVARAVRRLKSVLNS
jgi:aminoglycoside phosphotransferase (APT) family kinase protein